MRFFNRSVVLLICCTFFLVSCSKDDEDENKENIAFSPIELPALRNGADDIFLSPTTTFNGQKVTLESKAMIVGIFVLLQIVFIQKMPMSKLSIIAI